MLTYADVCSCMLTYAVLTYASTGAYTRTLLATMLHREFGDDDAAEAEYCAALESRCAHVHVCSRMLTYADVC